MTGTTDRIVEFSSNFHIAHGDSKAISMDSLSVWGAFESGMQILQRYATRSTIDTIAVAKSNLQLLHSSLSRNPTFNQNIVTIQHEAAKSGLPTLKRIHFNQGLTADLVALLDGETVNLPTLPRGLSMYLIISGSVMPDKKNDHDNPAKHWWSRIRLNTNKHCLRDGAVIAHSGNQQSHHLTALGKDCVLLRVQTPLIDEPFGIAS